MNDVELNSRPTFRVAAELSRTRVHSQGDVAQIVFGSFIPREGQLLVDGVQVEVRNGIPIPFVLQPKEDPMILCFTDAWKPMTPGTLSECLGIPERALTETIDQWQRDPEDTGRLIFLLLQRNLPSTQEVQNT